MSSLNFTDAAAYQAYVLKHSNEVFKRLFLSFKSAMYFTHHQGVKGKKTLQNMTIQNLFRRYASGFAAVADAVAIAPKEISTVRTKVDLTFVPSEFEDTYLGEFRKMGQDPMDFPFIAYVLEMVLKKAAEEMEIAIWQGEAAAVPAATDTLSMLFDGLLHQIEDQITATDLTAVSTGAPTVADILDQAQAMYAQVADHWKTGRLRMFCSHNIELMFRNAYQDKVGKYTDPRGPAGPFVIDFLNIEVIPTHGLQGSDRMVLTIPENPQYAYDSPSDHQLLRFQQDKREMHAWMDARIGTTFLYDTDASGALVVNDQP